MQTRHLLLLLSLGAVQLSHAAYQLQWETPSPVTAFVNYNTALTGTLKSDEDCENETFCKPVEGAEVSLTLTGLGLLSADPYTPPPPAPVAVKAPGTKAGKATPLEDSQGSTPLNVTTNGEGRFLVYIWSDAWGSSTVNATSIQDDSTLEAGELAVNWVTPAFKTVVEPAALDDTVSAVAAGECCCLPVPCCTLMPCEHCIAATAAKLLPIAHASARDDDLCVP